MSENNKFSFKTVYTGVGKPDAIAQISIDEIQNMTMPEFLQLEGRLVRVKRRKRRDMAIWEPNVAITIAMFKEIFRKGVGEQDTYATSATAYTKTRAHTNMPRGGNFGEGSLTIITSIEAHFAAYALRPTTLTGGLCVNPLGVAVAAYDPGLFHDVVTKQFEVGLYKGEDLLIDGLVQEFPAMNVNSFSAGAAVGALVQNGGLPGNYLNNPVVLKNDEDFHVLVSPLTAMDMSTGAGLTLVNIPIMVKLSTIELRAVNP